MALTQTNTQNNTKQVEHQDPTDIQKKLFVCVFRIFSFLILFLFIISLMISLRNVELPPRYCH